MLENNGNGDQTKLTTLEDILNSESSYYKLPSEFFEKILEYEVNLKEKFDPKIFFELINFYSKAIGFYESINDPKFIIYNQALNYLFEKPEARKFLEGKDLGKEFRKKEIIKRFKQCDKIVTEEKVKSFIEKRTNAENIKSSIDNLYNKDIEKQKNSFKKKLEEKKLKYKDKYKNRENEKNENINIDNKEIKEIKQLNENENKENIINNEADNIIKEKENENNKKKEEKINDDEFKIDGGELLDVDNVEEEQEEISEIDFNLDDVMELVNIAKEENKENNDNKENKENKNNEKNNNEKNDDKKDIEQEQKSNSTKNTLSLKKSLKRTNKTRFYEKMLENWDNYFSGYYEYFINNNIDIILKDFEDSEK